MSQYVANLGGAFLYSTDPKSLAKWYEQTLGIKYKHSEDGDCYYADFQYHPLDVPNKQTYAVIAIFKAEEKSALKTARLNYRVFDIEAIVNHIKELAVEIDDIQEYPEGKFTWLHDPEGNKIELWQDTNLG